MNHLVTDNMGLTMLENEEMLSIYGGSAYSSGKALGSWIKEKASDIAYEAYQMLMFA
jgi:hypothetical protein